MAFNVEVHPLRGGWLVVATALGPQVWVDDDNGASQELHAGNNTEVGLAQGGMHFAFTATPPNTLIESGPRIFAGSLVCEE